MGGNTDDAKRLFFFVTGGYADKRWFWESVVLARKAALVVVAFAIQDARLRVYAGIWTVSLAFLLNAIVQPYSDPLLHRLETSSLMTIAISLSLSLLFNFYSVDEDLGLHYAVLVAILAVNGIVLLAFLYGLAVASRSKLIELGKQYPRLFGPISRALFEDTVESQEGKLAASQKERDALAKRLRRVMPRMLGIAGCVAARPPGVRNGFVEDSKRALTHYDSLLRTAAVRLERLPDPVAQIKEIFEAERSVIEAELDLTRAYRQDLLNELLLTMQM
jgi:hypothetical protein